jgi:heat shock protein HslJ
MRTAMLAVTAVLVLGGCAVGAQRPADSTPAGTDQLAGVEWRLTEVVEPSGSWSPQPGGEARLRFDGDGGWSGEPCNHLTGAVRIDSTMVHFEVGGGTDMACSGARAVLERAFGKVLSGQASWAIEAGTLRIDKADGWGLRFRVSDQIYPRSDVQGLAQGRRGRYEYRFGWQHCKPDICLSWERRDAVGRPWGTSGMAFSEPSLSGILDFVGDALFLGGVVPPKTTRVIYQPSPDADPVELPLYDVPGVSIGRVFGGFVDKPVAGASWIALDASGRELLRRDDVR